MIETDWYGLYKEGWRQEIVKESFAHPAKFARGLIRRIYEHAFEQGYLKEGDWVIDPFAGVALGALDAMLHGLHWIGIELEERFVGWGRGYDCDGYVGYGAGGFIPARCGDLVTHEPHHVLGNIELWNRKYGGGRMPRWGTALLLRGDSRYLKEELSEAIGSWRDAGAGHGETDDNLGNMPEGDLSAAISSPPWGNEQDGGRRLLDQRDGMTVGRRACGYRNQGEGEGQLGQMETGDIDAVISSPPYIDSMDTDKKSGIDWEKGGRPDRCSPSEERRSPTVDGKMAYGNAEGQIGSMEEETFWSASYAVVSQCHQVLAPGGIAIWVVKDFVRDKKRVPFCDQWRRLCEAVGFETIEIARAWFIDDYGVQKAMFGPPVDVKKKRKSFFRRVYENKARAEKHWNESVCRDDRAHYLSQAHRDAWEEYKVRLLEEDEEEPPYPSRHRILHLAQKSAYKDAGSPDLPIDVAIDYEIVLFMRKVEDETKTV